MIWNQVSASTNFSVAQSLCVLQISWKTGRMIFFYILLTDNSYCGWGGRGKKWLNLIENMKKHNIVWQRHWDIKDFESLTGWMQFFELFLATSFNAYSWITPHFSLRLSQYINTQYIKCISSYLEPASQLNSYCQGIYLFQVSCTHGSCPKYRMNNTNSLPSSLSVPLIFFF